MADNLKKVGHMINRRIGQKIDAGEREVARKYAQVLTEIRSMMANAYEKWEVDGQLTWAEMAKFDRMNKMMADFEHLLKTHYKDLYKQMPDVLGDVYQEGYALTAWAVETDTQALLNYSTATTAQIEAMIAAPVAGLTLAQTLERNRSAIIYTIRQEVVQGFVKGETYSTMAKRLKTSLEGDAVKAMRIVRTEGHRYQESAKHDAVVYAEKQGIVMGKTWNSSEDSRVRRRPKSKADHKKLNNKTIATHENFDDGLSKGPSPGSMGAAGSDINCRCFLTYEVIRVEKKQHPELENIALEEWQKTRLKNT